jgi:hypothetical protein
MAKKMQNAWSQQATVYTHERKFTKPTFSANAVN